jgi:hypothetical protein
MTKRIARIATILLAATGLVGLIGVEAAQAAPLLTLSQSTNLTDGQAVSITLSGVVTGPQVTFEIAECGNAYANGSPLITVPRNPANCEVLTFATKGQVTTDPFVFADVGIRQTGIGTGNRSCVSMDTASVPCVVYVSASVNQPVPFPSVDVSFVADIPSPEAAATTTTISPTGSPIGADKIAYAAVHVVKIGSTTMRPEGSVSVLEGTTVLGSADLVNGEVSVALGTLPLGPHDLVAQFNGNGSFAPSNSESSSLTVIGANNVAIGDATVVEGNAGNRTTVFPVVLSKPSPTDLLVYFDVAGSGSSPAAIGTDLANLPKKLTGKLKFKALKQTVLYIKVQTLGDTAEEADETFSVTLTPPVGSYVLRRGTGIGTIINDDSATPASGPTVSIGDSSVAEGDVGSARNMSLAVTLSQPVTTGITTVYVLVSSVNALHGKKTVGDWGGAIVRKVKFKPGVVSAPVAIAAYPDVKDEPNESVVVTITSVSAIGTTVSVGSVHPAGVGTILTDE